MVYFSTSWYNHLHKTELEENTTGNTKLDIDIKRTCYPNYKTEVLYGESMDMPILDDDFAELNSLLNFT